MVFRLYAFRFDMARRAMRSAAWVSFDLFDTLLRRVSSPASVAADAAVRLAARCETGWTADEILRHRRAWALSREAGYPREEAEWSIESWLQSLAIAMELEPADVVKHGCQSEFEAEFAGTAVRASGLALLLEARRMKKRHFVLSDTTLTAAIAASLLEAHGLGSVEVIASSEWKRSKRRGTIFSEVEGRLGLDGVRGLHVGDNLKSDFVRPLQAGWRAAHLPPGEPRAEWDDAAGAVLRYRHDAGEASLAGEAAHVVLSTAAWICRAERTLGTDCTLFLARDAEPLLAACDRLARGTSARHYVRLSRRAILLAHPGNLLYRVRLSGKVGKRSLRTFVAGFELPETLRDRWLASMGELADAPLKESTILAWQQLLDGDRATYDALREEAADLLRDYLRPRGGAAHRLLIVDLGWAGTVQDAVAAVFSDREVHGRYAGVTRGGEPSRAGATKAGLVFDLPAGKEAPPLGTSAGVMRLWELLLREPAGTVRSLQRQPSGEVVALQDAPPQLTDDALELAAEARALLLQTAEVAAPAYAQLLGLREADAEAVLERVAKRAWQALTLMPDGGFARRLLDLEMDEGASRGVVTTLGLGGLRAGVSWWPGLVAGTLHRRGGADR